MRPPFELHIGNCIEVMRAMPDNSVDSIVTDPPYHLTNNGGGPARGSDNPYSRSKAGASTKGFMGQEWDGGDIAFNPEMWREALRVLKPGGHLLAFSGSRTYHRMAVAIEDAGFEIRDQIMWLYGSGFPKSRNIAEMDMDGDAARQWQGWGTALKPAHEPICVARKPLVGTVAANVMQHGTGALNIDGCRVEGEKSSGSGNLGAWREMEGRTDLPAPPAFDVTQGRWPANVIHDGSDEVVAAFPQAPGQMARARTDGEAQGNNTFGALNHITTRPEPRGDTGSAARFFYSAKASKADRGEGNIHPTVKPTDLMRYLCRLVTPPGGVVLDPFMGSGSTGKAAVREGFRFIGCDLSAEYAEIARARISFEVDRLAPGDRVADEGQTLPLFEEEAA